MKKILYIVLFILICWLFCAAFVDGAEREAKRQCIVAIDNCEKYPDAGACNPEYLKVCEGWLK